jgi:hypothetical protein
MDGPMTGPEVHPQDGLSKLGSVVQVLSGAVGLVAYISLAGGIAEWTRMAGAGLPASQALAAFEPVTLIASGFQTLVIVPVALVALRIADLVISDIRKAPELPHAVTVLQRVWRIAVQVGVVFFALTVAIVPAYTIIVLLVGPVGGVWLTVIAAISVAALPLLVRWLILRPALRPRAETPGAEADTDEENDPGPSLAQMLDEGAEFAKAVPPVARRPLQSLVDSPGRWLPIATALELVAIATVAAIALLVQRSLVDVDEPSLPWIVLACMLVLLVVYTAFALALGGLIALRSAASIAVAEMKAPEAQQADLALMLAGSLAFGLIFVPLSWGVFYVSVIAIVMFASARPETPSLGARSVFFAAALALGLMAYQAHSPQRFDLLTFTIQEPDQSAIEVRAALVGSRGDAYTVAVCDRRPFEVLGATRWESGEPSVLRFDKADVVDAEIVSGGYTFLRQNEPSIAGALLSTLAPGGLVLPRTFTSANLYGTFGEAQTEEVCGGKNNSATLARRAADQLGATR